VEARGASRQHHGNQEGKSASSELNIHGKDKGKGKARQGKARAALSLLVQLLQAPTSRH
jgi:hypothetical protein